MADVDGMIHTQDADFTLICADVLDGLRSLEDGSVHCVVTSPPYWGLRDYGTGLWAGGDEDCDHRRPPRTEQHSGRQGNPTGTPPSAKDPTFYESECRKCGATRTDQQLGLEATPDLYVARIVEVFREVRRVLRADGTCWVNLGDSYAHGAPSGTAGQWNGSSPLGGNRNAEASTAGQQAQGSTAVDGLKPKDLCGIPWRVAFALQADGWYLRSDIIWAKPNPMPESVTDRPTKAHEYVFLLTREARYFFDQEAVREASITPWHGIGGYREGNIDNGHRPEEYRNDERERAGRNVRSVWDIATQPYPEAHFATYPEELVRRCVLAGTSERGCCSVCGKPWEREVDTSYTPGGAGGGSGYIGDAGGLVRSMPDRMTKQTTTLGWRPGCNHNADPIPCTVLDPFLGSGTTAYVARKHGRRSIGIELNPAYCDLAARRMQQQSLLV